MGLSVSNLDSPRGTKTSGSPSFELFPNVRSYHCAPQRKHRGALLLLVKPRRAGVPCSLGGARPISGPLVFTVIALRPVVFKHPQRSFPYVSSRSHQCWAGEGPPELQAAIRGKQESCHWPRSQSWQNGDTKCVFLPIRPYSVSGEGHKKQASIWLAFWFPLGCSLST